MKAGFALFMIGAAAVLTACSYHVQKEGSSETPVPHLNASQLSFALVDQYVFRPRCVACHGNSGGVNLESYSQVKLHISAIRNAIQQGSMPKAPAARLSPSESSILLDWIDAGGPEHAAGTAPSVPDPLLPKFSSIQSHIFQTKCVLCHNPRGEAKNVPLDWNGLLTSGDDLVLPGNAEGSYLTVLISPGARKPMPPADSAMSPLTTEDINVIKEWIQNGAKND